MNDKPYKEQIKELREAQREVEESLKRFTELMAERSEELPPDVVDAWIEYQVKVCRHGELTVAITRSLKVELK